MANQMYLRYLKKFKKIHFRRTPDFDVLAEDPDQTAKIVKDRLKRAGINNVKIKKKKGVGEILADHYEILVNGRLL